MMDDLPDKLTKTWEQLQELSKLVEDDPELYLKCIEAQLKLVQIAGQILEEAPE